MTPAKVEEALAVLRQLLSDMDAAPDSLISTAVSEITAALAESERDAARYRWLRDQHWNESKLFVVSGDSSSVKLGTFCPSLYQLDSAIDSAMKDTDHAR